MFRGTDGVAHEHGDGHWADAARVRRDFPGDRLHGGEVDITHEPVALLGGGIVDSIDADIDHGCARLDHVGLDELGHAHRRDDDVRPAAVFSDIAAARVAEGDGGIGVLVFLAEDRRHRFADDVAPAKDHDLGALHRHAGADEQLVNPAGGARHETAALTQHQFADVHRVKSVDVFSGRYR